MPGVPTVVSSLHHRKSLRCFWGAVISTKCKVTHPVICGSIFFSLQCFRCILRQTAFNIGGRLRFADLSSGIKCLGKLEGKKIDCQNGHMPSVTALHCWLLSQWCVRLGCGIGHWLLEKSMLGNRESSGVTWKTHLRTELTRI